MDEILEDLKQQLILIKRQFEELKNELSDEKEMSNKLIEENARRHNMDKTTYISVFGDNELKTRYNIINKSTDEIPPIVRFGMITKGKV